MPTYRLDIEYDGTDWFGWQTQPDRPTIQHAIETALGVALRREASITGSGRTDTGVHARGQVAHIVLDADVDPGRLCRSVNGILPKSIAVRSIRRTNEAFHARYDALVREYRYQICCEPVALERTFRWHVKPEPDFERMNEAARALIGTRNFTSFCRASSETRNRVCNVSQAEWEAERRAGNWSFLISADRFLHGMVRSIVGTLIDVGHGRRPAGDIDAILQSEDRRSAGAAAPAHGLVLECVRYASDQACSHLLGHEEQPPDASEHADNRSIGH